MQSGKARGAGAEASTDWYEKLLDEAELSDKDNWVLGTTAREAVQRVLDDNGWWTPNQIRRVTKAELVAAGIKARPTDSLKAGFPGPAQVGGGAGSGVGGGVDAADLPMTPCCAAALTSARLCCCTHSVAPSPPITTASLRDEMAQIARSEAENAIERNAKRLRRTVTTCGDLGAELLEKTQPVVSLDVIRERGNAGSPAVGEPGTAVKVVGSNKGSGTAGLLDDGSGCDLRKVDQYHDALGQHYHMIEFGAAQAGGKLKLSAIDWYRYMSSAAGSPVGKHISSDSGADTIRGAVRDVASVIQALDAVKWLHRDISPSNIVLSDGRGILLDFHVTCKASDARQIPVRVTGKPAYRALCLNFGHKETKFTAQAPADLESLFYSLVDMASDGSAVRWRHEVEKLPEMQFTSVYDTITWRTKVKDRCLPDLQPAIQELHELLFFTIPYRSPHSVTAAAFKDALACRG
ncbi:hypothetical protein JKP88DRAFT_246101 [Tribonema minus]|uniref:Fungal-type protein kinase domain-containing protein n=1 Tax=Tribonema minus TaxID=303371 RepID=A0A836CDK0_9STRA|nr:hypothetical protein JKP88DRAFT_246101 [Tribonema minus]